MPDNNPFSGLLTTDALKQKRLQEMSKSWRTPVDAAFGNAFFQLAERQRAAGKMPKTPEDIRAERTDQILKNGMADYRVEAEKPGADPNAIISRLTRGAMDKFIAAGDYESAAALAPHVLGALGQEAEISKLEGRDANSVATRKLNDTKEALDEAKFAEDRKQNRAENALRKYQIDMAQRAEKKDRTQAIQVMDPDTGKPVWKLINADTGETINENLGEVKPSGGGAGGGRAQTQFDRILTNANLGTKALENIAKLPVTTNRGIFGSSEPGTSLLGSAKSALGNTVTTGESQRYRVLTSGLKRNIATIEAAGAAQGLVGLTKAMDQVEAVPGDTYLTTLSRQAETRQIIEEGLNTFLSHPSISDKQKDLVRDIIKRAQKAIPFTQDDITILEQSTNPDLTLHDVLKARKAQEKLQIPGATPGIAPGQAGADGGWSVEVVK